MKKKAFKQIAIEFILDGDSVQALMETADDHGINSLEAQKVILECFNYGLTKAYYNHLNLNTYEDVDLNMVTIDQMRNIPYIWLEVTEKTVPYYEALLSDSA